MQMNIFLLPFPPHPLQDIAEISQQSCLENNRQLI